MANFRQLHTHRWFVDARFVELPSGFEVIEV